MATRTTVPALERHEHHERHDRRAVGRRTEPRPARRGTLAAAPDECQPVRAGQSELREQRSERTRALLLEAHEASDPERRAALLDEVVVLNREVAAAVAARYRRRSVPAEDLEQVALEGLVKAVRRFDPTIRPDLLTYAVPTMRGEIQRYFRDQSWMVRPPRRIQELQWRISRSVEKLSQDLGRAPEDEEVCSDLGCEKQELDDALQGFGALAPPSLDQPVAGTRNLTLGDALADDGPDEREAAEARAMLTPALRRLAPRDRRILELRFVEERSQVEIGREMGVTQMQVSRLLARILRDLREDLGVQPDGSQEAELGRSA